MMDHINNVVTDDVDRPPSDMMFEEQKGQTDKNRLPISKSADAGKEEGDNGRLTSNYSDEDDDLMPPVEAKPITTRQLRA